MSLIPDMSAEDVAAAVAAHWDLSGALPVPKFTPTCPVCGTVGAHPRVWNFHPRNAQKPGRFTKRCSYSAKCVGCGFVYIFGIPISDADFDRYTKGATTREVHWREAERILDASQNQGAGRVPPGAKTSRPKTRQGVPKGEQAGK